MTQELHCGRCGTANALQANFCSSCGGSLVPGPAGTFELHSSRRRRRVQAARAVQALVLGVSSLFCFGPITGVIAIVLGRAELKAIEKGEAPLAGKAMAQWGLYLGIAGTVLTTVSCLVFVLLRMAPQAAR